MCWTVTRLKEVEDTNLSGISCIVAGIRTSVNTWGNRNITKYVANPSVHTPEVVFLSKPCRELSHRRRRCRLWWGFPAAAAGGRACPARSGAKNSGSEMTIVFFCKWMINYKSNNLLLQQSLSPPQSWHWWRCPGYTGSVSYTSWSECPPARDKEEEIFCTAMNKDRLQDGWENLMFLIKTDVCWNHRQPFLWRYFLLVEDAEHWESLEATFQFWSSKNIFWWNLPEI